LTKKIPKHPSLDIVGSDGLELSGKKIVLCVTGSVAAYKSIELARLLMRHGGTVTIVASDAATKLIQPAYFTWATGNPVITKLTGNLEHIRIADYKKSDLIIVYPCTANTLGKLASGIDDTPIATVLTVGFGSGIPIVMCLAMHASMYDNIAVKKNISFLEKKLDFVSPNMIEGKAKAAEPEDVLEYVLKKFGFSSVLHGKKVLITAGPTIEYIDPVRVITNQSTGRTGVLLASELVSAGASVTMVYGPGSEKPPHGVKLVSVKTAKEMFLAVKNEMKKKFDIVIMAAAPADYTPEKANNSKIKSTSSKMTVKLVRVPKIIDHVKKIQRDVFLVGFKALARVSRKELEREARKKMNDCKADLMVANDVGSPRYRKNPENNEVLIIDSKKSASSGWKAKEKIAKFIRKEIERRIA
jgi:phosphopantothenoylcysteine decarboxylase/phosphopantothenate--cysteine ligase